MLSSAKLLSIIIIVCFEQYYYNNYCAGYNSSNDIHDEFVLVNSSLDNCHDQHARCDQDHYPPGVTVASSSWIFTALCRVLFQEGRNIIIFLKRLNNSGVF